MSRTSAGERILVVLITLWIGIPTPVPRDCRVYDTGTERVVQAHTRPEPTAPDPDDTEPVR